MRREPRADVVIAVDWWWDHIERGLAGAQPEIGGGTRVSLRSSTDHDHPHHDAVRACVFGAQEQILADLRECCSARSAIAGATTARLPILLTGALAVLAGARRRSRRMRTRSR